MNTKIKVALILILLAQISYGCGSRPDDQPELGDVTGIVTLDGDPLEGVLVQFSPTEGRGSQAVTDSEGRYELTYVYPTMGAKVGQHKVTIETPPVDDSDPEAPEVEEVIPAKYRKDTVLTADVKPGGNEIDFELKSE